MTPCPQHPHDRLPASRCFMCAVQQTIRESEPEALVIRRRVNDREWVAQLHVKKRRAK